ncbi:MAG: M12 family metallopeptidase [Zetaproteobacteria bacterium]|nr:M12 family metallopeptidase [Zetaproteobacteria bacterium]
MPWRYVLYSTCLIFLMIGATQYGLWRATQATTALPAQLQTSPKRTGPAALQTVTPTPRAISTPAPAKGQTHKEASAATSTPPSLSPAEEGLPEEWQILETIGTHTLAFKNGEHWVTQGDLLVTPPKLQGQQTTEVLPINLQPPQAWPDGVVPYTIATGVDPERVQAAIQAFHEHTVIRLVACDDDPNYVTFTAGEHPYKCYSFLGMQGGEQAIVLGSSCTTGNVIHEIMHALGFGHTHSREDRDEYVEMFWHHIPSTEKLQYQKFPATMTNPANLDFDFDSVLMYPDHLAGNPHVKVMRRRDGKPFQTNRTQLSASDIAQVNFVYDGL